MGYVYKLALFLSIIFQPQLAFGWSLKDFTYPWKNAFITIQTLDGKVTIPEGIDYRNLRLVISLQGWKSALTLTSEARIGNPHNSMYDIRQDGSFTIPKLNAWSGHPSAWWTAEVLIVEIPENFQLSPQILNNIHRVNDKYFDWNDVEATLGFQLNSLKKIRVVASKHFRSSKNGVYDFDTKVVQELVRSFLKQIVLSSADFANRQCLQRLSKLGE